MPLPQSRKWGDRMWRGVVIAALLMLANTAVFVQAGPQQQADDEERKRIYLFQWVDDKGIVHITDGLGKVPQKYRDKATKLEQPQDGPSGTGKPAVIRKSPYSGFSEQEALDADKKTEWLLRMRNAKKLLADAERRYQTLEQQRQDALNKWGGPATGRGAALMDVERIEQEMKQAKQDVNAAREEVEVTIPDDARRAGVPPGWLRE
jgi:hypothetical protein